MNIWTVGFFGVPGKIIPVKVRRYIDKLMEDTHMFTPKVAKLPTMAYLENVSTVKLEIGALGSRLRY